MTSSAFVTRSWNGHAIQRRRADGYVSATAMCQAASKRWANYQRSDRYHAYLACLSDSTQIRVESLIETRAGRGGGTWVHPRLAVDLARWISPEFAVWMDGWILEELVAKANAGPKVIQVFQPKLNFVQEDAKELLRLVCEDVAALSKKVSALAGWPVAETLCTAHESMKTLKRRVVMAERLLVAIKPVSNGRSQ